MMEKMRVLIISMNGFGHISVGLGIADLLARHGHQSCFLLKKCFEDKITSKGHQFRSLESIHDEEPVDQAVNQMKFLESMLPKLKKPTIEQIESITEIGHLAEEHAKMNEAFENIIKSESFDLIITPTLLHLPAVEKSGIPWIYFHTLSPHLIYKEYIPPPFSGYSKDTDPETCQKFRDVWDSLHRKAAQHWIEYMARYGIGPTNTGLFSRESPYLNVYAYPRALDFHDVAPLPKNWFRMDNVVRQDDGSELNVPEEFLKREGKLIYLSLGSWFSGLVEVMKNLVDILRHSPHKFIVSRGPNYQKYELAENMWGERFLNQLKVLPIVDMVITHGGNNSTVECMYFGKPMIVLPCFVDQHDNAQRIDEKGFGVKLNPFKLDKTVLLGTIEKILADTEMHERCQAASNELKTSGTGDCVVKLFERIVADHKAEKDKKKEQDDIQIVQSKVSSVNLNGIANSNLLPTKSAA